ncbi:MAG: tRNA uridine-5-carboxymethylaminomethyl(34) synthesis GTPase MnmE [Chitinophagales bacterium]|nr:tRNA uridine-5-carboxymethylaminomethyl(34) synthesis GTPase MnmE [Chitinophagales bacterium]
MSQIEAQTDTIIALSTPNGVGAIAVIRLSGSNAIAITNQFFRGKNLLEVTSHTIHFGKIVDQNNNEIDEVLISIFKAPNSYTKENVVEISCHGSPYIQNRIIDLFTSNKVRYAKAGEFTLRAFLNGRFDLSQAEAVADLIASESESSHDMAIAQMRGGISNEIQKLRQELIDFAALIELELDFSEEDVEFADKDRLKNLIYHILKALEQLAQSFQLGNAIKNGVNTVIAGRPNAGKSTLLNVLLQEDRAIVSDIAGTTRDVIEEVININGIAFRLMDTAGLRAATDAIEAIGIQKTMEKVNQSSILLYVFDETELNLTTVEEDINSLYKDGMKVIIVANKSDKYHQLHDNIQANINQEQLELNSFYEKFASQGFTFLPNISAKQNLGIEQIKISLYQLVVDKSITISSTIISNSRHYEALQGAKNALEQALQNIDAQISSDFVALDIRHALNHLGEITGAICTDDLLDSIFSKFCIGK